MGEIGIPREQFLHDLKLWEIVAIRRGYEKRVLKSWETARFIAYCTVKSSMGGAPRIKTLQDLIRLPDEEEEAISEMPNDEEIKRLQDEIRKYNEQQKKP